MTPLGKFEKLHHFAPFCAVSLSQMGAERRVPVQTCRRRGTVST
jgi:hypothetical protein